MGKVVYLVWDLEPIKPIGVIFTCVATILMILGGILTWHLRLKGHLAKVLQASQAIPGETKYS